MDANFVFLKKLYIIMNQKIINKLVTPLFWTIREICTSQNNHLYGIIIQKTYFYSYS